MITEDGYCDKEIRSRIRLAKVKFMERKKILISKMNLDLRKRIVKCLVWTMECGLVCIRDMDNIENSYEKNRSF